MAKKTRKQKQRSATRRPGVASAPRPAGARAAPTPTSVSVVERELSTGERVAGTTPAPAPAASATPAPEMARRRVERINSVAAASSTAAARQQRQAAKSARYGSAAALVEPLDSEDPAIPFDRVPYVPADLRRVALIASVMVVLIIIAWAVVTHVVD